VPGEEITRTVTDRLGLLETTEVRDRGGETEKGEGFAEKGRDFGVLVVVGFWGVEGRKGLKRLEFLLKLCVSLLRFSRLPAPT